jgi:hypothetical protein
MHTQLAQDAATAFSLGPRVLHISWPMCLLLVSLLANLVAFTVALLEWWHPDPKDYPSVDWAAQGVDVNPVEYGFTEFQVTQREAFGEEEQESEEGSQEEAEEESQEEEEEGSREDSLECPPSPSGSEPASLGPVPCPPQPSSSSPTSSESDSCAGAGCSLAPGDTGCAGAIRRRTTRAARAAAKAIKTD